MTVAVLFVTVQLYAIVGPPPAGSWVMPAASSFLENSKYCILMEKSVLSLFSFYCGLQQQLLTNIIINNRSN